MELTIKTNKKTEFINVTSLIEKNLTKKQGFVHIFVPHTTAGITINEHADPDVIRDITEFLNNLVPDDGDYKHTEGNSPGHIKSSLLGVSLTIPIKNKKLDLGTWQGIFFFESDGPRTRKIILNEF